MKAQRNRPIALIVKCDKNAVSGAVYEALKTALRLP